MVSTENSSPDGNSKAPRRAGADEACGGRRWPRRPARWCGPGRRRRGSRRRPSRPRRRRRAARRRGAHQVAGGEEPRCSTRSRRNSGTADSNTMSGEAPVVDDHRDGDGDHHRAVDQPGDAAPGEELAQRLDVGGDPGRPARRGAPRRGGRSRAGGCGRTPGCAGRRARSLGGPGEAQPGAPVGDGGDGERRARRCRQPPHDVHLDAVVAKPLSMTCWMRTGTTTRPPAPTRASSDGDAAGRAQLGAGRACRAARRRPRRSGVPSASSRQAVDLVAGRVEGPTRSSRAAVTVPPSRRPRRPARARRPRPGGGSPAGGEQLVVAPVAATRPPTRNTTSSARAIVDGRLATTRWSCRPARRARPVRMRASVVGSTLGGGVVEQQQPGPAHQRPGQRDPLALPARQRHAPLADHGVVTAVEGSRRTRRRRPARGPARGARPASRAARSRRRSRRRGRAPGTRWRPGAQLVDRHASARPSRPDRARVGVEQPARSEHQRRLAGAGRPDHRHRAAGPTSSSTSSSTAAAGSWANVSPSHRGGRRAAGRPARAAEVEAWRGSSGSARTRGPGRSRPPTGAARRARSR